MTATDINALKDLAHELAPWAAVAIAWLGFWQSKRAKEVGKEAIEQSKKNGEKLEEVHKTVNGRVEQLVTAKAAEAHREGYKQGIAESQEGPP